MFRLNTYEALAETQEDARTADELIQLTLKNGEYGVRGMALLSLGIKNIHLGPALPAFFSPNVVKVLVEKFGIAGIGSVEEDRNLFLGESFCSR